MNTCETLRNKTRNFRVFRRFFWFCLLFFSACFWLSDFILFLCIFVLLFFTFFQTCSAKSQDLAGSGEHKPRALTMDFHANLCNLLQGVSVSTLDIGKPLPLTLWTVRPPKFKPTLCFVGLGRASLEMYVAGSSEHSGRTFRRKSISWVLCCGMPQMWEANGYYAVGSS